MPRIILLHKSKKEIALNSDAIIYFESPTGNMGETRIHLSDGQEVTVDESFQDVSRAMVQGS